MKMTILMTTIYGLSAAATLVAPHGLLDSKVVLIALALTCSAHIGWRATGGKRAAATAEASKTH